MHIFSTNCWCWFFFPNRPHTVLFITTVDYCNNHKNGTIQIGFPYTKRFAESKIGFAENFCDGWYDAVKCYLNFICCQAMLDKKKRFVVRHDTKPNKFKWFHPKWTTHTIYIFNFFIIQIRVWPIKCSVVTVLFVYLMTWSPRLYLYLNIWESFKVPEMILSKEWIIW